MFLFFHLLFFTLFPLSILLFLIVVHLKRLSGPFKVHKSPPPSPWKLPIIGNFPQLALCTHRSLGKLAKKHGPLVLMHLGNVPVLIASSSDAAREIMKTHELLFLDRAQSSTIRKITYNSKDIAFTRYGEYWRYAKSMAVQHLLSNKKVLSFQHLREEEMTLTMDKIDKSCGSVFNFSDLIISHTNNVFCKAALGRKFDSKHVKDLIENTVELMAYFSFGDYIPCLTWLDTLRYLNGKIENHTKKFDEFFEGVIEEHLHRRRRESTYGKRYVIDHGRCFIDILLEEKEHDTSSFYFERDNIKAILMVIF